MAHVSARLVAHLQNHVIGYLALFVALGGGGAYAATSLVGTNGKITGCVQKKGKQKGDVRVIAGSGKCRSGEQSISWNGRGLPGSAGQQGATGQTGLPGSDGAPGQTGPSGSSAANAFMGHTTIGSSSQLWSASGTSTPVANVGGNAPLVGMLTPNTTIVAKNLAVRLTQAPGGPNGSRTFKFFVDGVVPATNVSCVIADPATSCESATSASMSIPAHSEVGLVDETSNVTNPTDVEFGWSALPP
jgi:hypothetical protein